MTPSDSRAATTYPAPAVESPHAVAGPDPEWHRLDVAGVLDLVGSGHDGIGADEAARRLAEHGRNELEDRGSKNPLRILWEQISAVMVLILIAASLLSLLLGKYLEAGAIGAIVVLFALLGFLQEYRAEQAIAALRRMAVPTVRVVRDGHTVEIEAHDIVLGDIVVLEAGSVVPADLRLVDVANLRVQEATLTGESEPVDKQTEPIDRDDLVLGDRRCMAYSGTQVSHGRGRGVAVATGMGTELGRIAELLQEVDDETTPLQRRLDAVGRQLALAGIVVALLVVAMGAAAGESASDLVLTAIGVAVAVIPEGLPAVVTFTLAIGAQRMLRRNALIRKLPAVETLGSVTVVCSDKTGTLTQNRMTVTLVDVAGGRHRLARPDDDPGGEDGPGVGGTDESHDPPPSIAASAAMTLAAGALCNDGVIRHVDGGAETVGDPTETAILHAAAAIGIDVDALRRNAPRVAELPFDSERKRMTTVHGPLGGAVREFASLDQDRGVAFVKGAVDGLLPLVTHVWDGSVAVPIDEDHHDRIVAANDELAADGKRILAVAHHSIGGGRAADSADPDLESDLTLLGLIAMIDPPRPEVRDAVTTCRDAGIRVVMITGDHPLTAAAIARDLGIGEDGRALTGAELDRLSDDEFARAAQEVSVFARVSPEHKLRLVESMQHQGAIAAMTGDGVNDAPALKRSNIGVAMGITGTDVSKEASDMVLRDDDFTTIVAAVEEGRVIYDNLRRFVGFAVAGNLGKIIVMLGWPVPYLLTGGDLDAATALLPLQLLWLNLMTDGLLGLSMGLEPAERRVMARPPHDPASGLWAGGLGARTAWTGAQIGAVSLGLGWWWFEAGRETWQAMIFTTLALMQVFQALVTRSDHDSLFTIGVTTNRAMVGIGLLVVGLQLAALYTPLREPLELEPLAAWELGVAVAAGVGLLVVSEVAKARRRRRLPDVAG